MTQHPLSIKDGVLNTRYFSHYDQEYGKKKEVNPSEEAIDKIEDHLSTLKGKMQMMMLQRGENLEQMDNLREQTKHEGLIAYEKFINDKKRQNTDQEDQKKAATIEEVDTLFDMFRLSVSSAR